MEKRPPRRARPRPERSLRLRKPFALKLVVVLVALTVGASLWQGVRDYRFSRRRLDQIKNRAGVALVRQLALFIPPFWIKKNADGAREEVSQAELDAARPRVEEKLRRLTHGAAGGEVLDVVIFSAEKEDTFYASLSGASGFSWRSDGIIYTPVAEEAAVTIERGEQEGRAVRRFSTPMELDGETVGICRVSLSAEDLRAAEEQLWREMVRNVVGSFILAAGVSILLGALLTRPIRTLAQDMRAVSTSGDLDRRSTVTSADEIGDLARTFNRMVESLKEVQERRVVQQAMEKELGIARQIQKSLLPEKLPHLRTWEVAARWTPAKEVGGDYYDFIDLGAGTWGVAVADVSGKGVPASLIMSMTRCLLRLAARAGQGPSGTVALVDDVLAPDLKAGLFVSMAYLHVAEESGSVRIVRAGHNPPLIFHTREKRPELCQSRGVALGLRAGFGHQAMPEETVQLAAGDFLILYSDGIVEAMNAGQKEYGTARLVKAVAAARALPAEELATRLMADLEAWRGTAPQSDDITLVVLKRKP